MSLDWAAPHTSLKVTSTKREVMDHLWRDNQDENRATIRMRIDVATRPRVT